MDLAAAVFQLLHAIAVICFWLYRACRRLHAEVLGAVRPFRRESTLRAPPHVALVLPRLSPAAVALVAEVSVWCADRGARYITVHDCSWPSAGSALLRCDDAPLIAQPATAQAIAAAVDRLSHGAISLTVVSTSLRLAPQKSPPSPPDGCTRELTITLSSITDGPASVVGAARSLAVDAVRGGQAVDDIGVGAVDRAVRCQPLVQGVPDIDLALVFAHHVQLRGLLPWHLRLTEFLCVGALESFSPADLSGCLHRFHRIEQRFGK